MADLWQYRRRIRNLNTLGQKAKVKVDVYKDRYKGEFDDVFRGRSEVIISREEVLRAFERDDLVLAIKMALCWGFPERGGYGFAEYWMRHLLPRLTDIAGKIVEFRHDPKNWDELIGAIRGHRVDNGVYTKILYFSGLTGPSPRRSKKRYPCMILDGQIAEEIRSGDWSDFASFHKLPKNYKVSPELYGEYCRIVSEVAKKIKCHPEQIEHWLILSKQDRR